MSKTYKKSQNKNSMATFFKVLRFIGKYRFLLFPYSCHDRAFRYCHLGHEHYQ